MPGRVHRTMHLHAKFICFGSGASFQDTTTVVKLTKCNCTQCQIATRCRYTLITIAEKIRYCRLLVLRFNWSKRCVSKSDQSKPFGWGFVCAHAPQARRSAREIAGIAQTPAAGDASLCGPEELPLAVTRQRALRCSPLFSLFGCEGVALGFRPTLRPLVNLRQRSSIGSTPGAPPSLLLPNRGGKLKAHDEKAKSPERSTLISGRTAGAMIPGAAVSATSA